MGVSLGGLALLHAHRRFPTAFSGLFLQSGSFFTQATDGQESEFGGFRRIDRFVAEVRGRSRPWPHPVPMTMTCGADEENLANNEAMAEDLSRQGYDVMFDEFPGGHNWVTWRLALDAALVELIRRSLD